MAKYPLSFSTLNLHQQCPRKYKYSKIDKIDPGYRDMTPLLKGGAVHSNLENYPNPGTHKLSSQYSYITERFSQSDIGKKYLEITKPINELKFGLDRNLKEVDYSSKDAMLRGIIDRICVIDGVLNVIDWKTGKYRDEKFQDYNQLILYAVFLFNKYNIEKIRVSYVYVEHDLENSVVLERKYLEKYENTILNLINQLENDKEFNKNVSRLCDWCEYKEHCIAD